jgi:hypothetical protein
MAGGLNKKFMSHPVAFMKSHIIKVNVCSQQLIKVAEKNVDTRKSKLAPTGRLKPRDAETSSTQAAGI